MRFFLAKTDNPEWNDKIGSFSTIPRIILTGPTGVHKPRFFWPASKQAGWSPCCKPSLWPSSLPLYHDAPCNAIWCIHCNVLQCTSMQFNVIQCNAMYFNAMYCNAICMHLTLFCTTKSLCCNYHALCCNENAFNCISPPVVFANLHLCIQLHFTLLHAPICWKVVSYNQGTIHCEEQCQLSSIYEE